MNIEKIMKQMKANQHKLSDNGYSIFLYVHSDGGRNNQLQCLGNPAHLLVGVMTTLKQIKKACLAAGMKEPEFEKTCKKAFMIAEENDHE